MAPQADPARGTDEKFLIECLKAYDGNKIDFAVVGSNLGYTNFKSASNRWAALKSKHGFSLDGAKSATNSSSKVTKSPRAPRKKATKAKPEDTSSEVEASPAKNDQATSADEA